MADPVLPLKGDSTKLVIGAAIAAVGLATAEGFSSMDKALPEGTHEAAPEAGNDSVESGTTLDIESQQEHDVDVTAPEAEDSHLDMDSSLHNDPTPEPLHLEPENRLIETELLAEYKVVTTSTAVTKIVPIDADVQFDSSLSETAPSAQKDIEEVEIQVGDTDIKDIPTPESDVAQHIEAADTEVDGPPEEVPAKDFQVESEVDFVAAAEDEPSAIAQSEGLLPDIEIEAIPIPEDAIASVTNVEDQVTAPVDVRSDHAAVVEISSILPPNVEESPATLTTLVEPSYKSEDDEIVRVSVFPIFMHS